MTTMNSENWGLGSPAGDPGTTGRGTVGTDAPTTSDPTPRTSAAIGTVRPIIALSSLVLTLMCVALAFVAGTRNGLLLLATLFLAVHIWALGAHRLAFWRALWEDLTS